MMICRSDLPLIRRDAVIFLVLLGLCATAVIASGRFVAHMQLERLAARHRMDAARNRLDLANADLRDHEAYAAEYAGLLGRNIIGDERRPDWMQELEEIRRRNLVIGFGYTIAPQQPDRRASAPYSGGFEPSLSRMSFRLDLLHEGQLFAFLDALRTQASGWFIVDHCSVERIRNAPADAPDFAAPVAGGDIPLPAGLANLHAECGGGWLTLKKRGEA
jgi:hypothetical protein